MMNPIVKEVVVVVPEIKQKNIKVRELKQKSSKLKDDVVEDMKENSEDLTKRPTRGQKSLQVNNKGELLFIKEPIIKIDVVETKTENSKKSKRVFKEIVGIFV